MSANLNFNEFLDIIPQILPILLPILILQLILLLTALVNLIKKDLPLSQKTIWIIIIVFASLIGPVIYFAIGAKMLDDKIQMRDEAER